MMRPSGAINIYEGCCFSVLWKHFKIRLDVLFYYKAEMIYNLIEN